MTLFRTKSLVAVSIFAAGVAAFVYWPNDKSQPSERYRTQNVDRGDIVQTITANGALNPVVLVNVGT